MKKLLALVLSFILILGLSACGNDGETSSPPDAEENSILGKASLPLNGFHFYDDGIIIEADYSTYNANELIQSPKHAYVYEDNSLLELKPYTKDIIFKADISANGNEFKIPIKYFKYDGKTHIYFDTNPLVIPHTEFVPLNSNEEVLIYGLSVKKPIVYNLKTGTYRNLTEHFDSYDVVYPAVSDDGKYALVRNFSLIENSNFNLYLINIADGSEIRLPKTQYNTELYTTCDIEPIIFTENALIFRFVFSNDYYPDRNTTETYSFSLADGSFEEFEFDTNISGFSSPQMQPNFAFSDGLDGKAEYINLKTNKAFSYQTDAFACGAYPNDSGNYAFIKRYTEKEYSQGLNPADVILVDMKSQKEIDISLCIDKYDNTYSGYNRTMLWLGEDAFLLCYANGDTDLPTTQWICDIVRLDALI